MCLHAREREKSNWKATTPNSADLWRVPTRWGVGGGGGDGGGGCQVGVVAQRRVTTPRHVRARSLWLLATRSICSSSNRKDGRYGDYLWTRCGRRLLGITLHTSASA